MMLTHERGRAYFATPARMKTRPIVALGPMSELTTWIKKISPRKTRKGKSRVPKKS